MGLQEKVFLLPKQNTTQQLLIIVTETKSLSLSYTLKCLVKSKQGIFYVENIQSNIFIKIEKCHTFNRTGQSQLLGITLVLIFRSHFCLLLIYK